MTSACHRTRVVEREPSELHLVTMAGKCIEYLFSPTAKSVDERSRRQVIRHHSHVPVSFSFAQRIRQSSCHNTDNAQGNHSLIFGLFLLL